MLRGDGGVERATEDDREGVNELRSGYGDATNGECDKEVEEGLAITLETRMEAVRASLAAFRNEISRSRAKTWPARRWISSLKPAAVSIDKVFCSAIS